MATIPEKGTMLTSRELQVLTLISRGKTHRVIAAELHIKEDTVRNHAAFARARLGASNSPHAVALAFKMGLISLPASVEGMIMGAKIGRQRKNNRNYA